MEFIRFPYPASSNWPIMQKIWWLYLCTVYKANTNWPNRKFWIHPKWNVVGQTLHASENNRENCKVMQCVLCIRVFNHIYSHISASVCQLKIYGAKRLNVLFAILYVWEYKRIMRSTVLGHMYGKYFANQFVCQFSYCKYEKNFCPAVVKSTNAHQTLVQSETNIAPSTQTTNI